jgi:16S rRNA (cytidine1402-2'-O)-methyltransferase
VGKLYIVASPIGNLGDVTARASEVLGLADHVVAEDTRRSKKLLSHLGISNKTLSCFDAHASDKDLARILDRLNGGETIALLTDAGTPGVSDPGALLVRACRAQGIGVEAVPGPSAVTTAIAVSGLVDGPFWFLGFLPRTFSKRQRWLERVAKTEEAVILFEAPQRVQKTLEELAARQPSRPACVARELTKKFEEVRRGTVHELAAYYDTSPPRGEVVLVLGGAAPDGVNEDALAEVARALLEEGLSAREVARRLSTDHGAPRNLAYRLAHSK